MEKIAIHTAEAPQAIGPYSQAIVVGDSLYCSGQIPLDPKTKALVNGGIEAQTTQVMHNLQEVLKAAGCGWEHVVKTTIFLTDLKQFAKVNEVYSRYFLPPYPARATVQVAALPMGAEVEIEALARIP